MNATLTRRSEIQDGGPLRLELNKQTSVIRQKTFVSFLFFVTCWFTFTLRNRNTIQNYIDDCFQGVCIMNTNDAADAKKNKTSSTTSNRRLRQRSPSSSDVQQLLVIKKEVFSEWSPSMDQRNPELRHIKEEQEELWTSQEGDQLHEMKEDIITRFPFTAVTVKSEDDEEKPQSSPLLQSQTEDIRKTASPISSSATQIKTETNREDCGGSEPARNQDPVSHPQANTDEKASDCSETEVSYDWQEPLSDSESESGSQKREKPFVCDDCGKRFTLKKYLTLHIRIHTGEKPFGCDICGKKFNQLTHLKTHLTIHTGDKPFVCVDCGKSFSLKKNFNRHMRIHTGETLCCDVCGNRFQCQAHLTTHMIVHTGEKPFECGDCGKTFSLKKNLDRHMRVHTGETPFSCDVCGNIFQCQAHLVAHLRVHTGERPFGCVDCGKRFSLKKNLDRHMRVHSVDKPFRCDVCGKQYKDPSSLKTHMKVHS